MTFRLVVEAQHTVYAVTWFPKEIQVHKDVDFDGSAPWSPSGSNDGAGGALLEVVALPSDRILQEVLDRALGLQGADGRVALFVAMNVSLDDLIATAALAQRADQIKLHAIEGLRDLAFLPPTSAVNTLSLDRCNEIRAWNLSGQWPMDLSDLARLPQLRAIYAHAELSLRCDTPLPQVRTLRLDSLGQRNSDGEPQSDDADLSFLQCFEGLRVLQLTCTTAHSLAMVAARVTLEELDLSLEGADGLEAIRSLVALQKLRWTRHDADSPALDLSPLVDCTALKVVEIRAPRLAGVAGVASWGRLEQLQKLTLIADDADTLPTLDTLTSLETLALQGNAWTALPTLPLHSRLVALSLFRSSVSDLSPLSGCAYLADLDLRSMVVPNLAPLSDLVNLRTVDCLNAKLSPDALQPLIQHEEVAITYGSATKRWQPHKLLAYLHGHFKLPKLKDATRTCQVIKSKRRRKGAAESTSHWGGRALLASGEQWPGCQVCAKAMPLFLQMDLEQSVSGPAQGLLQFFYCRDCGEDSPRAYDPRVMLIRVLDAAHELTYAEPPRGTELVTTKDFVGLTKKKDKPTAVDFETLYESVCTSSPRPVRGDKLGGWPDWLDDPDWPVCPGCERTMELVVQINSDKGLGHTWGDCGQAFIFGCATHPSRFGFVEQG